MLYGTSDREEEQAIRWTGWAAFGLAFASLSLALAGMGRFYFHADEALFSSWGLRIASGDVLLSRVGDPGLAVDKPPLFFYVQAVGFLLFGPSEPIAKLPSLFAGLAVVLLTYALGRRLYGAATALTAAALVALAPYQIVYTGSAFLDELTLALALGACVAATSGHALPTGFALGLAVATKPQGGLYAPLVLWLLFQVPGSRVAQAWRFALGFGVVIAGLLAWSLIRPHRGFLLIQRDNLPLELAPLATWPARAFEWWDQALRLFAPTPPGELLLAAGLVVAVVTPIRAWLGRKLPTAQERHDLALAALTLGFLLAHAALTFPIWTRYAVILTPVPLLLLARLLDRGLGLASRWVPRVREASPWRAATACALAILLMVGPARDTIRGRLLAEPADIGPNAPYASFQEAADYVRAAAPDGAQIYDYRLLGWHYAYFLPRQIRAPRIRYPVFWFDLDPDQLALAVAHMRAEHRSPKFLILPWWIGDERDRVLESLAERGVTATVEQAVQGHRDLPDLTIYRLDAGAPTP